MYLDEILNDANVFFQKNIKFSLEFDEHLFITKKYHEYTDLIVEKILCYTPDIKFACKKKCSFCCNLRVDILPIEAFDISNYITTLPGAIQKEILAKLAEHGESKNKIRAEDYNQKCPFLSNENECLIYSARPNNCRKYYSGSVELCSNERKALVYHDLNLAERVLSSKLRELFQSKGFVMQPAELGYAINKIFSNKSLIDDWLKGRKIFEELPDYSS